MLEKPGRLLLLLWLSGLLGPPEDSLKVPLEGGLAGPIGLPPGASLTGMEPGSEVLLCFFFSFFPSATKLPIITCQAHATSKVNNLQPRCYKDKIIIKV
jgi:hypothetical protein